MTLCATNIKSVSFYGPFSTVSRVTGSILNSKGSCGGLQRDQVSDLFKELGASKCQRQITLSAFYFTRTFYFLHSLENKDVHIPEKLLDPCFRIKSQFSPNDRTTHRKRQTAVYPSQRNFLTSKLTSDSISISEAFPDRKVRKGTERNNGKVYYSRVQKMPVSSSIRVVERVKIRRNIS